MKIKLEKGQSLYFTSDTHYGHKNICKGTTSWTDASRCRDFEDVSHMNSEIVDNINFFVQPDDILVHLGDWSFGGIEKVTEFRNRILCQNIILITGNHDHHIERHVGLQNLFSSVHKYLELSVIHEYGTSKFVLMHFPIASWNNMSRGAIHLHGHVHFDNRHKLGNGKMLDVGMDGFNLTPYGLHTINRVMDKQPIKSLFIHDHHEEVENYK